MFSVLTSKIFAGTSAFLLLALGYSVLSYELTVRSQKRQLERAEALNAQLSSDLMTARANVQSLRTGLNTCNASVEATERLSKKVEEIGTAAVKAVQNMRPSVQSRIETISKVPVNTCDDVKAVLKMGAM